MYTLRQKVVWFALISRVTILLVQIVSNALIPDHDAKDVFKRPTSPFLKTNTIDRVINFVFGGLERWDAQYFLHIAENGYVYENTLAFFPFFPFTLKFFASILKISSLGILSAKSLFYLASFLLNTICFVKAADTLFSLSKSVLKDEVLAYKAALFFCINPASIFFSAPYSETTFALLTFIGMRYACGSQFSKFCAIPFGLAAATRSNGVLNIGFILYGVLKHFISIEWPLLKLIRGKAKFVFQTFLNIIPAVESCSIAIAPFIAYQAYCYVLFCTPNSSKIPEHLLNYGQRHQLVLPFKEEIFKRPDGHWCHSDLPLAYSYVQNHYWNVGFLRYYEWKQVPNFLLALPMTVLVLVRSFSFLQQHRHLCLHLGLLSRDSALEKSKRIDQVMAPEMFVFIVHIVFITIFCWTFVHIQITTRMICSSSPVPYWYAAYILDRKRKPSSQSMGVQGMTHMTNQMKKLRSKDPIPHAESLSNLHSCWRVAILSEWPSCRKGQLILLYFVLYFFLGTVMFSNFLPWT